MTQNNIKKITLSCITIVAPIFIFGQQVTTQAAVTQANGIDLNSVLLFVAAFLLIPLYITGNTFIFAAKKYATDTKKESSTLKKTGTLILLFFCYQALQAQLPATNATPSDTDWTAWIITIVIVLESLLIVIFSSQSLKFISRSSVDDSQPSVAKNSWLQNFWNKINSFKPIAEESDIDTGHSYDGIRELDNITPPWFATGFALTIIFAAIYLYRYHVSKSAPLQSEEYKIEMAQAEQDKAKYMATQTNNVDENTVTMLSTSEIEKGKKTFTEKCIACHAANGGSMPGGVGPNLTDSYWIHGGGIKDIFKSIKYGWVEKGMISWKDQLSSTQIAQLASFIRSINGSNPANAKEPQGELYSEVITATDTTVKDTTKLKK